jgi:hypothetical protein
MVILLPSLLLVPLRQLLSTIIVKAQIQELDQTEQIIDGWRVLRYTRRIGKGEECYNRVRDAALNWEFHTGGGGDDNHD